MPRNRFVISTFAKKLGFDTAKAKGFRRGLRHLAKTGALKVTQGGYRGDSVNHPRIVTVKDWVAVQLYFKRELLPPENLRSRSNHKQKPPKVAPKQYFHYCRLPGPCSYKKELKAYPRPVCTWTSTCNQKVNIAICELKPCFSEM